MKADSNARGISLENYITLMDMISKQGYALKNWVEGLSDEAYYPCRALGVTKKNRLKSVNPTFFN